MKGKRITSITPIEGALQLFKNIVKEREQDKEHNLFRNKFNNIIVDTCIPVDTGAWETGVKKGTAPWIIVSQYESREEAEAGHKGWVELLEVEPEAKLKDIDMWNLEVEPEAKEEE